MKKIYLFFTLFTFIFVSSCTQKKVELPILKIDDGGLLSDSSCIAPCFLGIIPGKTTKEKTILILSSFGDIDKCNYSEKITNGVEAGIQCSNINLYYSEENIVNVIGFSPTNEITLDQVIKKYGYPDEITALKDEWANDNLINISLLFNDENMIIQIPSQKGDNYEISPFTKVEWISFSTDEEFNKSINLLNVPWNGYGIYN